jgi:hypothetical protein
MPLAVVPWAVVLVPPAVVPVVVPPVVPLVVPLVEFDDIPLPMRAFISMNRSLALDDELVVPLAVPAVVPDVPVAPAVALADCRQPVTVIDF